MPRILSEPKTVEESDIAISGDRRPPVKSQVRDVAQKEAQDAQIAEQVLGIESPVAEAVTCKQVRFLRRFALTVKMIDHDARIVTDGNAQPMGRKRYSVSSAAAKTAPAPKRSSKAPVRAATPAVKARFAPMTKPPGKERGGAIIGWSSVLIVIGRSTGSPDRLGPMHERRAELSEARSNARRLAGLVTQVRLGDDQVEIDCSSSAIAAALHTKQHPNASAVITIVVEARLTRSGRVLRQVQDGASGDERTSLSLTRLLVQAHRWWKELRLGQISLTELAGRKGVTGSYLTRVLRLAFLSPALTQAILAGKQPIGIDVRSLTLTGTVAASWADQMRMAKSAR